VLIVEGGMPFVSGVRESHLRGALLKWLIEAWRTLIFPSQGAPRLISCHAHQVSSRGSRLRVLKGGNGEF
jgi:hypothetical protein